MKPRRTGLLIVLAVVSLLIVIADLQWNHSPSRQDPGEDRPPSQAEVFIAGLMEKLGVGNRWSSSIRHFETSRRLRAVLDSAEEYLQEHEHRRDEGEGMQWWDSAIDDPGWQKGLLEPPTAKRRI
jgi:hypothetical protein